MNRDHNPVQTGKGLARHSDITVHYLTVSAYYQDTGVLNNPQFYGTTVHDRIHF